MTGALTILGIDPGSQVTGFGVIAAEGAVAALSRQWLHPHPGRGHGRAVAHHLRGGDEARGAYRPDEICIERVFMHRNADSALKLGHARAAALCGTFTHAAPVHEYAPREIKLAVTGSGAAEKEQVAHMVRRLLSLKGALAADAADALAVAICHAQLRKGRALRAALAVEDAGDRLSARVLAAKHPPLCLSTWAAWATSSRRRCRRSTSCPRPVSRCNC
jgi:crossover junction endodeoxyribonuclease RuvC